MTEMSKTLYTAEASVEGGREGRAHTSDDRLAVDLDYLRARAQLRLVLSVDGAAAWGRRQKVKATTRTVSSR